MNTPGGTGLIAAMATPAVLLLGNAMLILSTNQRLQAILTRLTELQRAPDAHEEIEPVLFRRLADKHARRARYAHRALLAFYSSGGSFVLVVLAIGASGFGVAWGRGVAVVFALAGAGLLALGILQLVVETSIGLRATDDQFRALIHPHPPSDEG